MTLNKTPVAAGFKDCDVCKCHQVVKRGPTVANLGRPVRPWVRIIQHDGDYVKFLGVKKMKEVQRLRWTVLRHDEASFSGYAFEKTPIAFEHELEPLIWNGAFWESHGFHGAGDEPADGKEYWFQLYALACSLTQDPEFQTSKFLQNFYGKYWNEDTEDNPIYFMYKQSSGSDPDLYLVGDGVEVETIKERYRLSWASVTPSDTFTFTISGGHLVQLDTGAPPPPYVPTLIPIPGTITVTLTGLSNAANRAAAYTNANAQIQAQLIAMGVPAPPGGGAWPVFGTGGAMQIGDVLGGSAGGYRFWTDCTWALGAIPTFPALTAINTQPATPQYVAGYFIGSPGVWVPGPFYVGEVASWQFGFDTVNQYKLSFPAIENVSAIPYIQTLGWSAKTTPGSQEFDAPGGGWRLAINGPQQYLPYDPVTIIQQPTSNVLTLEKIRDFSSLYTNKYVQLDGFIPEWMYKLPKSFTVTVFGAPNNWDNDYIMYRESSYAQSTQWTILPRYSTGLLDPDSLEGRHVRMSLEYPTPTVQFFWASGGVSYTATPNLTPIDMNSPNILHKNPGAAGAGWPATIEVNFNGDYS